MEQVQSLPWYRDKEFFGSLLRIAMPVALQNLMSTTVSMIDSIMVGSVGETALASVSMGGQWGGLMYSCYWSLCCGGALFFAQYWGARNMKGIQRAFSLSTVCMLLIGLVFFVLAVAFPRQIVSIYTNVPEIQAAGAEYLRIIAFAYLAQIGSAALSSLLRSVENVKLPLYASMASILTNTSLNWVLIYGKFGLPAMGVRGAAIASVIAAFVNFLVLLVAVTRKKSTVLEVVRHAFWVDFSFVREYFTKSTPIILNELLYGTAGMIMNIVFGRQGADNLAAMSVFNSFAGMIYIFLGGMCSAAAIMVGKAIGGGKIEKGMVQAKRFALICPIVTFTLALLLYLLREPIIGLYTVSDGVKATIISMMIMYMVTTPMRATTYVQVNIFRAGGETKMGMLLELGGIWLLGVPLVFLTGMVWNAPFIVVYMMQSVEDVVKTILEPFYLFSGRWIKPVTQEGQQGLKQWQEAKKMLEKV